MLVVTGGRISESSGVYAFHQDFYESKGKLRTITSVTEEVSEATGLYFIGSSGSPNITVGCLDSKQVKEILQTIVDEGYADLTKFGKVVNSKKEIRENKGYILLTSFGGQGVLDTIPSFQSVHVGLGFPDFPGQYEIEGGFDDLDWDDE